MIMMTTTMMMVLVVMMMMMVVMAMLAVSPACCTSIDSRGNPALNYPLISFNVPKTLWRPFPCMTNRTSSSQGASAESVLRLFS